jgi:protein-tyrosine phosphatase
LHDKAKLDWILKNVALSSGQNAEDRELLKRQEIGAILNVRGDEIETWYKQPNNREAKYCKLNGLRYQHLQLPDFTTATDAQFIQGIAFIAANTKQDKKVLVHCAGGYGRSPSFVAVYLLYCGESANADSAVAYIKNIHKRCFDYPDNLHISRIDEFEKRLPEIRNQIENMIKGFTSDWLRRAH